MGERAGKLFVLIALSFAVLVVRLAVVQLGQHEVWAEEAARLVHKGIVIPYRRGEIRFAGGEVAARDVEAYRLSFAYRPFRRLHPLGQVAHARTSLELRAVTLRETERNLVRWGAELVELRPAALDAFARGEALVTASLAAPATDDPSAEDRRGRASDVRFYVRALMDVSNVEARALEKRASSAPERTYAELLAAERGIEHAALVAELKQRWESSLEHLAFLAAEIELEGDEGVPPYEALLDALEESRRAVEGAAATALFEDAAGFPPGRLAPETLLTGFDLEELRIILRWDVRDLGDWARRTRASWLLSWRDGYALPRLVAELTLDPAEPPDADRILSTLASLFGTGADLEAALAGTPTDWREIDDLAGLFELDDLFRTDAPGDLVDSLAPVLPFQDPALRGAAAPSAWSLLDDVRLPIEREPIEGDWVANWKRSVGSNRAADRTLRFELARELVDGWEGAYQAAMAEAVQRVLRGADADERGARGGLRFRRGRLERLAERASYVLKDYGDRERQLETDPSYDVVFLLTRFPERYPGLSARDARRREVTVLEGDDHSLAEKLLGFTSRADVRAMQRQRADASRMRELRHSPNRTPAEEDELAALIESVLLPDEVGGVAGIEGFFDPELRGHNGYREIRGQEDIREARAERSARDGKDVTLTLVAALQRAAERVISAPTEPVDDASHDPAWYRSPIGAIVLLTTDGDVLAAASSPVAEPLDPGDAAREESETPVISALERTLRRPTFQPPGSVFKPFLAAWALDHDHLDPSATVNCSVMADGHTGYVDVRCWSSQGHGYVDLRDALKHSCNAYFAHLGESLSMEDLRGAADAFGFGQPTGIATPPGQLARAGGRNVRLEDPSSYLFQRELSDAERRRAGNGLAVVEATPMQIARGFAGLATGTLPSVRIVSAVGGEPVERAAPTPVPISPAALDRVREALLAVTNESGGTAASVLSAAHLGFTLAAKTGSADLVGRSLRDDDGRVRKHTWVAGWAPIDGPRFVVVVFIHDTSATSSHGAVYVARELLEQPEVRAYLTDLGMALEDPR